MSEDVKLLHPQSENAVKHGHARHSGTVKGSPTYVSWQSMRSRCNLDGRQNADRYREKGIRVCERGGLFLGEVGRVMVARSNRIPHDHEARSACAAVICSCNRPATTATGIGIPRKTCASRCHAVATAP